MGAQIRTNKFSHVLVSAVRQSGTAVGVGIVFRTREGVNVRKIGYVLEDASPEQATYQALLTTLSEAQRASVRGLTIYIDNPQVVDQLNRRGRAPADLRPLFVQVRCLANSLRRVRFKLARAAQGFAARRLARTAAVDGRPVNIEYDNPLLPLSFGEDVAA